MKSRDRRFDGVFYTAVRTTGIYCRPSAARRGPRPSPTSPSTRRAAAAQAAGFRACKRCLPDATPGSPEWDVAADVAGRAMRLIADGLVDREGVDGLARRVGYTPRHLGRLLTRELGAAPLALARARRAQTARVLIETTELSLSPTSPSRPASPASGSSTRPCARSTPSPDRAARTRRHRASGHPGAVAMRLAVRTPFAGAALLDFLAYHLVPGVEVAGPGWYARTLDLPHGPGTVRLGLADMPGGRRAPASSRPSSRCTTCATPRPRASAYAACSTPTATRVAVDDHLAADPVLGRLVRATPGLRVPGQVDGDETAVRTVIGQQVSVTGARTVTGRIVAEHGRPGRLAACPG